MSRGWLALAVCLVLSVSLSVPAFPQAKLFLSLDKSLETALKNNKAHLSNQEKILASEYKVKEAKAGYYPKLSLNGSLTYLGVVPSITIPFLPAPIPVGFHNNYDLNLAVQQPLFTWGRIQNSYSISKSSLELDQENYKKDRQRIIFDVTNGFYSALLCRELIVVQEDAMKNTEEHLRAVELRYKAGQASEFELLRAKVQLANVKPALLGTKHAYDMALSSLKLTLGLPQETELELDGELSFKPIQADVQTATQDVIAKRSEIKSLAIQENIARSGLSIAKAGNKPSLIGMINYDYKKPFNGADRWDSDWNIVLALSVPLFDGFATKAQVGQAQSGLRQLDLGRKDLEEAIKLEIKEAVTSLDLARERILSQDENIKQSTEGLRIAKVQYQQGMITSLEEMDAELALTYARIAYIQALADYYIAGARYDRAIGK